MHLLITVNAAWNIWNFRRSLVAGLLSDGHRITVLAPPDDAVPDLERLGCRFGAENRSAIDAVTLQGWVDAGDVEYLGTTSDVRPAIAAATCVVLPSYREGASRTLIEAAAMARPLIATDVPGCRAVVDAGVSGFFCDARSADSLAAAVAAFLELPHAARSEMGRQGRAKMERDFDEALVLRAYRSAIWAVTAAG